MFPAFYNKLKPGIRLKCSVFKNQMFVTEQVFVTGRNFVTGKHNKIQPMAKHHYFSYICLAHFLPDHFMNYYIKTYP
jgi:hypothetical protein